MESGDDFRLALGNVERRTIRLGDTGNPVHNEQREKWPHEPLTDAAGLCGNNLTDIETTRCHENADQREAHGDFVRNDLGCRPHRA